MPPVDDTVLERPSVDPITGLSDEDFKKQYAEPTPQESAVLGVAPDELSDDAFKKVYSADPTVTSKPENQFDPLRPVMEALGYIGNKVQGDGELSVVQGRLGVDAMMGKRTYESVANDSEITQLKVYRDAADRYEKQNLGGWAVPIFGEQFDFDLRKWTGTAAASVPFMRETMKEGIVGGAIGATAGAGTALAAGQLGPQVSVPEEVVSVPFMAKLGWDWGYKGGAFKASATLMAGQAYLDYRKAGLDHETARFGAIATGAISGFIETMQLGQLASVGKKALNKALTSEVGKNTFKTLLLNYGKEVGVQWTEEQLQQATQLSVQALAGWMSNNPNAVPTQDEVRKEMVQNMIQALQASTVLVGGSAAGGHVAGKVAQTSVNASLDTLGASVRLAERAQGVADAIQQAEVIQRGADAIQNLTDKVMSGSMPLVRAFRIIKDAYENKQPTQENIQNVQNMSQEEALQSFTKPLFDEQGNIQEDIRNAPLMPQEGIMEPMRDENGKIIGTSEDTLQGRIELTVGGEENAPVVEPSFDLTDPNPEYDQPLGGAPSLEVQGRINQVSSDMRTIDKDIRGLEREFKKRDAVNSRAAELKSKLDELNNQQLANAAQIEQLNNDLQAKEEAGKPTANIRKTLDQIGDSQQAVVNQIARAQKELNKLKPASTDGILTNLETLYDKRSAMEEDLVMLRNGLYESQDLKGLDIKMKADKLLTLRAKAANEMIKTFRRGVREGIKFTKDEIQSAQTQLVSLVRKSGLELKDQAKFIQRLKNIQTQDQLRRALPQIQQRVDTLLENEARRDANTYLNRVLSQASLSKGGKRPVGKYVIETQQVLDTYKRMIQKPDIRNKAIDRELNDLMQNVRDSENLGVAQDIKRSQQELQEAIIAKHVGDLENKSAADITVLADEIKGIIEDGKAKRLEKKLAARQKLEEDRQRAFESINGDKPVDTPKIENSRMNLTTRKNNALTRLQKTLGRTIWSWNGLMDILSQNDSDRALTEIADVHEAIRNEYHNQKVQREAFFDEVANAVGKSAWKVLDRMVAGSKKQEWGMYTDADGNTVPLVATRNELINLWAQTSDTDLWDGLTEGNRYTLSSEDVSPTQKSTIQLLNEVLTDDDKNMAKGVVNFYNKYFHRLNDKWMDVADASLIKNENYAGPAHRREPSGVKESAVVNMYNEMMSRSTIKPTSTISRTANAYALELSDVFMNTIRHIQEVEHWLAWESTDKTLRSIFTDRDIRNTIKLKYGDGMMRTIDDRYHDQVGTRSKQNEDAHNLAMTIRKHAATAYVGGKLPNALAQFSGVLPFMLHVGSADFVRHFTDFITNVPDMKRKVSILESSPMMQERGETLSREIMDGLQNENIKGLKKRLSITDIAMWMVKNNDRMTIWAGGWTVYASTLEKTGDHEQAIRAFEKAFNSTQSSGTIDQMSQLERSGVMGKMITLFAKQPLQMLEAEITALRKAANNPTQANISNAIRTIAIVHTTQVLFQAIASMPGAIFGSDDERDAYLYKLLRAFALGPFNALPVVGDLMSGMATQVTNWVFDADEMVWTPKSIIHEVASRGFQFFKHGTEMAIKAANGDEITAQEVFRVIEDYARSVDLVTPIGGIPKDPMIKFFKFMFVPPEESSTKDSAPEEDLEAW